MTQMQHNLLVVHLYVGCLELLCCQQLRQYLLQHSRHMLWAEHGGWCSSSGMEGAGQLPGLQCLQGARCQQQFQDAAVDGCTAWGQDKEKVQQGQQHMCNNILVGFQAWRPL